MRKTKVNKRKNKYSKKTRKSHEKNNLCEKGITDEVLMLRGYIKELRNKYKKTQKMILSPKALTTRRTKTI